MTLTGAPSLVIAEVFGPTIQGEGPSMGRRASFVRLGGCNLQCSFCDTAYTWDANRFDLRTEMRREPVADVVATIRRHETDLVVITGGEPMLQQRQLGWSQLLAELCELGTALEIETNGTVAPTPETARLASRFNVSPKLANSGAPEHVRVQPDTLRTLRDTGKAIFKFVAQRPSDLDEVTTLVAAIGIPAPAVWIMPEGTTAEAVLNRQRALADAVIDHGFNLTTRLHALIWSGERRR